VLPHKPGLVPGFVREPAKFVTGQAGMRKAVDHCEGRYRGQAGHEDAWNIRDT
jgi:hypothetical protein